ncbi:MAG TPA: hypothetical protein DDW94_07255 [Deltaproteobacteria bacterium]|nr:MAG: hypothetical protein A2Z79_01785 [Deltaproteobacteria bacterium GWA2_55_82]OGQ62564.1 MAG: hypothetical protein A3I81_08600 [Deltaproteobacteria bacterium RIFCSPLOWO2_02_FULL_55_12]OIJ74152.1 MAG: hypothetical protein A2V21_307685 [Deltaproteobacteria bacterium GWC2_55_46]HBG46772.1 hypothetical protein [Deltaproteobacteria bacterium]HCY11219.1 hypothetical protein [Deltaproteobacteria bacterium]
MARDYYEILGIPRNASEDEIKKAYRNLARQFHPDLHPDKRKEMEAKFKEINEAYHVLSNPKKRSDYDLTGKVGFETGTGAPGYAPGGVNFEEFGFGFGGFEDIFSDLFGRGARRRAAQRGADIEYSIELDFMRAVKGADVRVSLQRMSGPEVLTVKVPAGIRTGSRVRVTGKGEEGLAGGPPGDLYIITSVRPHPYFRREDNDIYVDVPITLKEALLGAEIEVPTIDGPSRIKIPSGTQGGQKLRVKGKGVQGPRGERGDEYVVVKIAVPKKIDDKSRKLIEEFEEQNPYEPRKGLW